MVKIVVKLKLVYSQYLISVGNIRQYKSITDSLSYQRFMDRINTSINYKMRFLICVKYKNINFTFINYLWQILFTKEVTAQKGCFDFFWRN